MRKPHDMTPWCMPMLLAVDMCRAHFDVHVSDGVALPIGRTCGHAIQYIQLCLYECYPLWSCINAFILLAAVQYMMDSRGNCSALRCTLDHENFLTIVTPR